MSEFCVVRMLAMNTAKMQWVMRLRPKAAGVAEDFWKSPDQRLRSCKMVHDIWLDSKIITCGSVLESDRVKALASNAPFLFDH